MIQQRNMMDYYPNKGKISNIENARSPLPMSNSPRPTSFKPLKVNLPTVPTDSPGLKGNFSPNRDKIKMKVIWKKKCIPRFIINDANSVMFRELPTYLYTFNINI